VGHWLSLLLQVYYLFLNLSMELLFSTVTCSFVGTVPLLSSYCIICAHDFC
jgi:hypothetical protein